MVRYLTTRLWPRLDRRAVTSLEYGLIAGVIVVSIIVGFTQLEGHLREKFSGIGVSITNEGATSSGG